MIGTKDNFIQRLEAETTGILESAEYVLTWFSKLNQIETLATVAADDTRLEHV